MSHFIVASSAAKMPVKCWGRYRRVAVPEVTSADVRPAMISERARGVVRIVATWERLHAGRPGRGRTAYDRALRDAAAMADRLNAAAGNVLPARPVPTEIADDMGGTYRPGVILTAGSVANV